MLHTPRFIWGGGKDFNKSNQINVVQRRNLLLQGSLQGGALVLRWSRVIFVIRFLIGGILMESKMTPENRPGPGNHRIPIFQTSIS